LSFVSIFFVWPAVSCGIMALAYVTGLSRLLGKENGTLSPASEWCLLPMLIVTAQIQRKWLKRRPGWHEVTPGVFFGRKVTKAEAANLTQGGDLAVIDLTAESNAPVAFRENAHYHNLPLLDLVPLKPEHITAALHLIREERATGRRVFLHCQLGLQRSALIAAHWLVDSGEATDLEQAKAKLRIVEPAVLI
jgi:hypothetical protein